MTVAIHVDQKRASGLGASQAAAALGVSPWESPIKLWLKLTGRAKDDFSSAAALAGNIDEPIIRGLYAAKHGADVFPSGITDVEIARLRQLEAETAAILRRDPPGPLKATRIMVPRESWIHPMFPWLRCTPDGILEESIPDSLGGGWFSSRLVQIKRPTVRTSWHWGHPKVRTCPPHYRIQATVEMAVTGLNRCDFAVRIDADYFEVQIDRDMELEEVTLERLADFWRLVETDTPPEVDDAQEWRSYFADRLPRQRVEIVADPGMEALIERWREHHFGLQEAQKQLDEVRNRVIAVAAANQATVIMSDHGPISVRRSKKDNVYVVAPESWGAEEM